MPFDQTKYINGFISEKYDRINFLVPKGQKEVIKAAAEAAGKSVNAYIWDAVQKQMRESSEPKNG